MWEAPCPHPPPSHTPGAAADGLAVGAAALSSQLALTASVALAMVFHKLPVAAGLTAYLRPLPGWHGGRVLQGGVADCMR